MKNVKTMIASVIVAAALVSGPASAARLKTSSSSVDLNVFIKDGVATIYGHVESSFEKNEAGRVAMKLEGVTKVRNLLTYSN